MSPKKRPKKAEDTEENEDTEEIISTSLSSAAISSTSDSTSSDARPSRRKAVPVQKPASVSKPPTTNSITRPNRLKSKTAVTYVSDTSLNNEQERIITRRQRRRNVPTRDFGQSP